ncbi:MAG: hypothetical protein B1H11_09240 [Desulfobacteraceae bacterium 4484_190.1]|nr:MAG: hypothetical protein B1H11_09240 [Desulfobacteraceae bacterium 4484_190.1]
MDVNFVDTALKMVGTLAFILIIILFIYIILKRLRLKSLSLKKYPEIRLIGTLYLAPKRSIALIEVCGEWLVVGVGTESVSLLTKLPHPPESLDIDGTSENRSTSFSDMLRNSLSREGRQKKQG